MTFDDRSDALAQLHAELFPPEAAPAPSWAQRPTVSLDDQEVLRRMFSASNGRKLKALFHGDTSAFGDDDSRADLSLCAHLAFWCGGSKDQVDRLFRQSGLYREKWERADYAARTIDKALEGVTEFYVARLRFNSAIADWASSGRSRPPGGNQDIPHDHADGAAQTGLNLPDDFWQARASLATIRQAAHSRSRSADAGLGVVLSRVAATIEPASIATGVAAPASLNFFSAIIGPPGSGKSNAWSIGCELYPAPYGSDSWFADNQPLGTGEGLAEAFMGSVRQPPDFGKKTSTIRQQVRRNACFFADEGEALTRFLERSGATVGETLRRGWIGTTLGQRNGSAETTRSVSDYSLGLVIGFQPVTAMPLLADVRAGTPQRFVYFSAIDPSIPEDSPPWPTQPKWYSQYLEDVDWTICSAVREEIRALDRQAQQQLDGDPYDAHSTLTRIKIAGLLAVLEMRKNISAEDWQLSLVVWQTSCAARESLRAQADAARMTAEQSKTRAYVGRETAKEEAADSRAMRNAINAMAGHVRRGPCEGGCKRRCLNNSIAWRDRQLIDVGAAIELAVQQERFRRDGDFYVAP